jgi:hypothetical protein
LLICKLLRDEKINKKLPKLNKITATIADLLKLNPKKVSNKNKYILTKKC